METGFNILDMKTIAVYIFVYFAGIFTGYIFFKKLQTQEVVIFLVIFVWLTIVPISFFFDKEIPGYFDIVAGMITTFYAGVATEKGMEMLKFIKDFKGKK